MYIASMALGVLKYLVSLVLVKKYTHVYREERRFGICWDWSGIILELSAGG
jgi:hypothetical protein